MAGVSRLAGHQEYYDGFGNKQSPLGFGFQADWELLERRVVTATQDEEFFWEDGIYDEIEVVIMNWSSTTDSIEGEITLSTDGSTFHTGASDYDAARWSVTDSPGSGHSDQGGAHIPALTMGDQATEHLFVTLRIGNVSGSGQEKPILYDLMGKLASGATTRDIHTAALNINTDSIRGINIGMASTNTYDAIIIVRGRRITPVSLISQDDWVVIEDRTGISASSTEDFFWDDQVYDQIEVCVWGVTPGTDDRDVQMRLSQDGSTFLSGTGDYKWAKNASNDASGTGATGSASATEISLTDSTGTGADEHKDVVVEIHNVSNTTRKKTCNFKYAGISSDAALSQGTGSGVLMDANDSIRGVQFLMESAATFSADRIRVRGRRLTPTGVLKQDWEVLNHQALTSGAATVEFVSIPVEEFDELELSLKDVDTDTSANQLMLQFSSDNGATWKTGASDYHHGNLNVAAENTTATIVSDNAHTNIQLSANFGSSSVRHLAGQVRFGPLDSTTSKQIWCQMTAINDSGNMRSQVGGGVWVGTDSDAKTTAFRLGLEAGGNFTAGSTFTLRGRRKL